MGGLDALQSNSSNPSGCRFVRSSLRSPLCYVEFVSLFVEEPGHSSESPLNQVGSRKSNEKQLDVIRQGWVAF